MMKLFFLSLASLLLISCGASKEEQQPPAGSWTYPINTYKAVRTMAQRTGEKDITRMVGWDEDYYYFDWHQEKVAISRGTARVEREQFDTENRGALTLEKGNITVKNGQVRTVRIE